MGELMERVARNDDLWARLADESLHNGDLTEEQRVWLRCAEDANWEELLGAVGYDFVPAAGVLAEALRAATPAALEQRTPEFATKLRAAVDQVARGLADASIPTAADTHDERGQRRKLRRLLGKAVRVAGPVVAIVGVPALAILGGPTVAVLPLVPHAIAHGVPAAAYVGGVLQSAGASVLDKVLKRDQVDPRVNDQDVPVGPVAGARLGELCRNAKDQAEDWQQLAASGSSKGPDDGLVLGLQQLCWTAPAELFLSWSEVAVAPWYAPSVRTGFDHVLRALQQLRTAAMQADPLDPTRVAALVAHFAEALSDLEMRIREASHTPGGGQPYDR